eukprot:509408_1
MSSWFAKLAHENYYKHYAMSSALILSLSTYKYQQYRFNSSHVSACGIMAMIAKDEFVVDYLLEGLSILQNRGYDSAGIATINSLENRLECTKYASKGSTSDCLELLSSECPIKHKFDRCGIAHTRWATHGGKTDLNSHPHCDMKSRIALVHNGTISNCTELKTELLNKGYSFKSETDTEVIANLIGYYLDELEDSIPVSSEEDSILT